MLYFNDKCLECHKSGSLVLCIFHFSLFYHFFFSRWNCRYSGCCATHYRHLWRIVAPDFCLDLELFVRSKQNNFLSPKFKMITWSLVKAINIYESFIIFILMFFYSTEKSWKIGNISPTLLSWRWLGLGNLLLLFFGQYIHHWSTVEL